MTIKNTILTMNGRISDKLKFMASFGIGTQEPVLANQWVTAESLHYELAQELSQFNYKFYSRNVEVLKIINA